MQGSTLAAVYGIHPKQIVGALSDSFQQKPHIPKCNIRNISQRPVQRSLMWFHLLWEPTRLKNSKAVGVDRIQPEIWKHEGPVIHIKWHKHLVCCWEKGRLPQDLHDAIIIITLYKKKIRKFWLFEQWSCCRKSPGTEWYQMEKNNFVPETHCGFSYIYIVIFFVFHCAELFIFWYLNTGVSVEFCCRVQNSCTMAINCLESLIRSTTDMMFVLRQLQNECREPNKDRYVAFVDLTKPFETVSRGLWQVLKSLGCPPILLTILIQLHKDQRRQVRHTKNLLQPLLIEKRCEARLHTCPNSLLHLL